VNGDVDDQPKNLACKLDGVGRRSLPSDVPEAVAAVAPAARRGSRADYFPNFTVRTHEGKRSGSHDDLIWGKIVVINMMYADCTGICPAMTENLLKVQRALEPRVGRDIFMYSDHAAAQGRHAGGAEDLRRTSWGRTRMAVPHGGPARSRSSGAAWGSSIRIRRSIATQANHTGVVRFGNEAMDSWGRVRRSAPLSRSSRRSCGWTCAATGGRLKPSRRARALICSRGSRCAGDAGGAEGAGVR
jgi:protein SCO1/2